MEVKNRISVVFAKSLIAYSTIEKESFTDAFETLELTQYLLKNNTIELSNNIRDVLKNQVGKSINLGAFDG